MPLQAAWCRRRVWKTTIQVAPVSCASARAGKRCRRTELGHRQAYQLRVDQPLARRGRAPAAAASPSPATALAIWPLSLWSGLGTRRHEYGVTALLAAYPAATRRPLAEWVAGVACTALVVAAPAVRMAVAGDWPAWPRGPAECCSYRRSPSCRARS